MKLKDHTKVQEIRFRITKKDVARAEGFCNAQNCLIATALRRRGWKVLSVNEERARLGDSSQDTEQHQFFGDIGPKDVHSNYPNDPPYTSEVVGKTFVLRRRATATV